VITGDAGILGPQVVAAARLAKHEYLLGIKGNAGRAHGIIKAYPWDKIEMTQENCAKGHGRKEFRSLKRISLSTLGSPEIFEKYQDISFTFLLTRLVKTTHTAKITEEVASFVGSQGLTKFSYPQIQAYARDRGIRSLSIGCEMSFCMTTIVLNQETTPQGCWQHFETQSLASEFVLLAPLRNF
jgi:hypothetical protein